MTFRPTHKLTVTSKSNIFVRQPPVSEGIPHIDPTLNFRFVLITSQPSGSFLGTFVTTDYIVSLTEGAISYFKDAHGTFFKLEPLS